ncbi:MAG: hypothetical protein WBG86_09445 [Polyangiales bacterium]
MGALWICVASAACAGGATTAAGVEFTPDDAQAFDNAVDFIDKPAIVESEWRGDFESRVTRSDGIAIIRVTSISGDKDRRGSGYRLTVEVTEVLEGALPTEIVLRVHDDEPGFRSVQANEDRLLGGSFVTFVKWQANEGSGGPIPRWHLSPNSAAVREKVRFFSNPPPGDDRTQVEVVSP